MAARQLIITYDPATGKMDYKTVGFGLSGFSDWTREESYGNQLVNGEVEVIDATGKTTVMADGCHLVKRDNGYLQAMTKDDYEEWTGRPGSANED